MSEDRRAKLEELHRDLVEQFTELTSGEQWLTALADARRFHRYSPANQLLLALQGAQGHVAGYRTWQRINDVDGNPCQVAKGQKGLSILAPMVGTVRDVDPATGDESNSKALYGFRVVKVFHEAQLVRPPAITHPPLPQLLTGENRYQHIWSAVAGTLNENGFAVDLIARSPLDKWNGRTRYLDRAVDVAIDLEPPQRTKTLLHEWAHVHLDHEHRPEASSEIREVEAESVAYLVAQTIELDTSGYSVPYVAGWAGGDGELIVRTAERVIDAAGDMVATLEQSLNVALEHDVLTHDDNVVELPRSRSESAGSTVAFDADPRHVDTPPGFDPPPGVRELLGRLDPSDRARLIDAVYEPEARIDTLVRLCADAGATAEQIADLTDAFDIAPEVTHRAMRTATIDGDDGPQPLFDPIEISAVFPGQPTAQQIAAAQRHPSASAARPGGVDSGLDAARIFATRIAAGADGGQLADLANGLGLSTRDAIIAAANGGASDDQLAHLAVNNHAAAITAAEPSHVEATEPSTSTEVSTGDATLDIIRRWDLLAEGALVPAVSAPEITP